MEYPVEELRQWEMVLRQLLGEHISRTTEWGTWKSLVQDQPEFSRRGNLVERAASHIINRIVNRDLDVSMKAIDPRNADVAREDTVLLRSIMLSNRLNDVARQVLLDAMWAPYGVFEVGHQLDPASLDPLRRPHNPNVRRPPPGTSDFFEVDVSEVQRLGVSIDQLPSVDVEARKNDVEKPVVETPFGLPYFQAVDPRLVLLPKNSSIGNYDYCCRIRFLSRQELALVTGVPDAYHDATGELRSLFNVTEPTMSWEHLGGCCALMELWVLRDRRNPGWSNTKLTWVWGSDVVISCLRAPLNGLVPLVFLSMDFTRPLDSDTTFVSSLAWAADVYSDAVDGMAASVKDAVNPKWLESASGKFKDETSAARAKDPAYSGRLEVNGDGSSIVPWRPRAFDDNTFRLLMFLRGVVDAKITQNPMDRGEAIKGITAHQTQALIDITGMSIEGTLGSLSRALEEVSFIAFYLLLQYGVGASGQKRFEMGSIAYDISEGAGRLRPGSIVVRVHDSSEQKKVEDRLAFQQSIRALSELAQTGLLPPQSVNWHALAQRILALGGEDPGEYLQAIAPPLPTMPGLEAPMMGTLPGGLAQGASGGLPPLGGQHPERLPGSRGGLEAGNLVAGAMKTGLPGA